MFYDAMGELNPHKKRGYDKKMKEVENETTDTETAGGIAPGNKDDCGGNGKDNDGTHH